MMPYPKYPAHTGKVAINNTFFISRLCRACARVRAARLALLRAGCRATFLTLFALRPARFATTLIKPRYARLALLFFLYFIHIVIIPYRTRK